MLSEDRLFVTGEKSNVNYSNNRDDYFDCDIIYFFSYEYSGYTTIENEEFPIVTHDKSFLELIDCANSRIQNKSIKWIKAKRVLSTISKSISAMAKSIKTNFFIWVALVFCLAMVVAIIGSLSLFFYWLISLIYVDVSVMFFIPTTIIQ
ncbi:MAG: hypothetical protein HC932_06255 [Thermales bacterium]|nr:hypothetical protein [Thermales bacterium]